jgi:hypothetical protein
MVFGLAVLMGFLLAVLKEVIWVVSMVGMKD